MNKQFEQEIIRIKEDMERLVDKDMKPILEAYKRALNDVREDIAKLYVKYAVDGALSVSKQQRYTILKQLENKLLQHAKEIGYIDLGHTTKILEDVFSESYYQTAFVIDKGIETAINFAILKPEFVKAAIEMPIEEKMFSDRIWDNKSKLVQRVRKSVEKAMIQGTSIDKLARDIKKEFGSSAYESKRLIHTEVARCQSQAQNQIYKDSGLVKKVMWSATLDKLTNPEDAVLDGKMWDIDEEHPSPPLHPNCRCCLIPVVPGWTPTKRRENIKDSSGKKPIIDYQDYNSWKQSKNIS
ncbi:minor capsid protein [Desulforamulus aeronauticus]|uniref:Phage putative head morphogenesis protein, SPP1 gp7 family n=1 Tax=Desulforamulus aeronauticus DSM 10349 TaxID=1121421 RepID=A0A1M6SC98_9FIRM|nr:minor capsid protein [Desulforamulus aeronauticus]SHK42157.1 phage putative head morphogenesis protein, SPP1 gp7 family [Desulforamulus aeronauticus DSM 10349]